MNEANHVTMHTCGKLVPVPEHSPGKTLVPQNVAESRVIATPEKRPLRRRARPGWRPGVRRAAGTPLSAVDGHLIPGTASSESGIKRAARQRRTHPSLRSPSRPPRYRHTYRCAHAKLRRTAYLLINTSKNSTYVAHI